MPREIFMVPMEGTGTRSDPFRGKYTLDAQVISQGTVRSARTSEALVMIEAPQTYLDFVAAQADSMRLATEANIDNTLTANQANAAKTFVQARGIPGDFVNQGDTRRQVLRAIVGLFLFCQRMEGRFGAGFKQRAIELGITFDTIWNDFPRALKDEFIAIRDSFGWDNLGLTGTSTLRQIMLAVSQKFETTPMFIGGWQI